MASTVEIFKVRLYFDTSEVWYLSYKLIISYFLLIKHSLHLFCPTYTFRILLSLNCWTFRTLKQCFWVHDLGYLKVKLTLVGVNNNTYKHYVKTCSGFYKIYILMFMSIVHKYTLRHAKKSKQFSLMFYTKVK